MTLTIDRKLEHGPVEMVDRQAGGMAFRNVRVPGNDTSDLPADIQSEIAAWWTPARVAAWNAMIAPTQAELDASAEAEIEHQRILVIKADALRQDMITQLRTATPTQISDYVDANVTNLAGARTMLKRIILILAGFVRE